jgi:hypothetical protein
MHNTNRSSSHHRTDTEAVNGDTEVTMADSSARRQSHSVVVHQKRLCKEQRSAELSQQLNALKATWQADKHGAHVNKTQMAIEDGDGDGLLSHVSEEGDNTTGGSSSTTMLTLTAKLNEMQGRLTVAHRVTDFLQASLSTTEEQSRAAATRAAAEHAQLLAALDTLAIKADDRIAKHQETIDCREATIRDLLLEADILQDVSKRNMAATAVKHKAQLDAVQLELQTVKEAAAACEREPRADADRKHQQLVQQRNQLQAQLLDQATSYETKHAEAVAQLAALQVQTSTLQSQLHEQTATAADTLREAQQQAEHYQQQAQVYQAQLDYEKTESSRLVQYVESKLTTVLNNHQLESDQALAQVPALQQQLAQTEKQLADAQKTIALQRTTMQERQRENVALANQGRLTQELNAFLQTSLIESRNENQQQLDLQQKKQQHEQVPWLDVPDDGTPWQFNGNTRNGPNDKQADDTSNDQPQQGTTSAGGGGGMLARVEAAKRLFHANLVQLQESQHKAEQRLVVLQEQNDVLQATIAALQADQLIRTATTAQQQAHLHERECQLAQQADALVQLQELHDTDQLELASRQVAVDEANASAASAKAEAAAVLHEKAHLTCAMQHQIQDVEARLLHATCTGDLLQCQVSVYALEKETHEKCQAELHMQLAVVRDQLRQAQHDLGAAREELAAAFDEAAKQRAKQEEEENQQKQQQQLYCQQQHQAMLESDIKKKDQQTQQEHDEQKEDTIAIAVQDCAEKMFAAHGGNGNSNPVATSTKTSRNTSDDPLAIVDKKHDATPTTAMTTAATMKMKNAMEKMERLCGKRSVLLLAGVTSMATFVGRMSLARSIQKHQVYSISKNTIDTYDDALQCQNNSDDKANVATMVETEEQEEMPSPLVGEIEQDTSSPNDVELMLSVEQQLPDLPSATMLAKKVWSSKTRVRLHEAYSTVTTRTLEAMAEDLVQLADSPLPTLCSFLREASFSGHYYN